MNPAQVHAQAITEKSKSNFASSFFFLRPDQKRAMEALYAFSREVDDAVDESASADEAEKKLQFWSRELDWAYEDKATHPILKEITWAKNHFKLHKRYFIELIDGVAKDLHKKRYGTFEELLDYTYGVASTVGLLCMAIFEVEWDEAEEAAILLGRALQLTNILRDIRSDAVMGRIYLPLEDLKRFSLTEQDIFQGRVSPRFDALMFDEIKKSEEVYAKAFRLLKKLPRKKVLAAWMMGKVYYKILKKLKRNPRLALEEKFCLSKFTKGRIVAWQWVRSFFP